MNSPPPGVGQASDGGLDDGEQGVEFARFTGEIVGGQQPQRDNFDVEFLDLLLDDLRLDLCGRPDLCKELDQLLYLGHLVSGARDEL